MTSDFMTQLLSKKWSSNGSNTIENSGYNNYSKEDWRIARIKDNKSYYPPANVDVEIIPEDSKRGAYSVDHHGTPIKVPETRIQTFQMKASGADFAGREALNAARFIVYGDYAVSSPIVVDIDKSVVIHVRLRTLPSGRLIMVNELVWQVQYETDQVSSDKFYDIQKWYCCGYP